MKIQSLAAVLLFSLTASFVHANSTLTIYTSQPNEDAQQTFEAFEKANPDITVNWIRDGTTKLMARLQAEVKAGAKLPDALLIADNVTMESLKAQGLLSPYTVPNVQEYDEFLYDPDGYYHGTRLITTGIAYHTQAPIKPTSWFDLINPQVKNMVAMPSPLYSGAALIHLATVTEDPQLGWTYYENLKNNGVSQQGGNGGVLTDITTGNKAYGVLVDYMALREKAKGAPIDFVFPKEGVSVVTEPVAILKGAQNPDAAKRFVNFILSDQGQQLILEQGYIPANNKFPMPDGFPERSEIKAMKMDAAKALQDSQQNIEKFSQIFGDK